MFSQSASWLQEADLRYGFKLTRAESVRAGGARCTSASGEKRSPDPVVRQPTTVSRRQTRPTWVLHFGPDERG